MHRRTVLSAFGAAAVGGCTASGGVDGDCSNADPGSAVVCGPDDLERFDPEYGTGPGETTDTPFELRPSDRRVEAGEPISFRLTNTAWFSSAETGNRSKFSIDRLGEDGWRSIYVAANSDRPVVFTDEAVSHGGRSGFAWEFTATTDGLDHPEDGLVVCPEIDPGWYRFVYWGLIDDSIGACFEIVPG